MSSSGCERVLLHADEKLVERYAPRTADAGHLDVRALHEQRRQRVARRVTQFRGSRRSSRGCESVATRRCATPLRAREALRQTAPPIASEYVSPAPSRSVPFSRDQPRSSSTSFRLRRVSGRARSKLSATITSVPPWIGSASGCSAFSRSASSSDRGVRTSTGTFYRSSRTYGTPSAAGAPSLRLERPVETSTSTTIVITYGSA